MCISYYEKIGDSKVCVDSILPFSPYDNCEFVRFGSLVELLSGRDLKTEEYNANGTGTPYITGASNFKNGIINIQRWTNAPQVISEKGDILITCKGTIGEIALNDFGTAHIARQVMAIRNNFNLNVDYLLLCIKYYLEIIKSSAQGLIPGISRDIMLDLIVPLPSEKYQTAVVNVVLELNTMLERMKVSLI